MPATITNGDATTNYATLAEAVAAAREFDVIDLAGDEVFAVTSTIAITKSITIRGANFGRAGLDGRDPESVIAGSSTGPIFQVIGAVDFVITGVKITGDTVMNAGEQGQTVTVTDSVLDIVATQDNVFYVGNAGGYVFNFLGNKVDVTGYTEFFQLFQGGEIDVSSNRFTGRDGAYVSGDDNDVPLILNISDGRGVVRDNVFTHLDIGVLVANGAGPLDITGNSFQDLHREEGATAGGRAAGVVFFQPAPFADTIRIEDNQFTDADAGIRTSGVPGSTTEGSDIVIVRNDFDDVTVPLFQPENVGGTLTATESTVDDESVAVMSAGDDAGPVTLLGADGVFGGYFATIQVAVNAAQDGDTILIEAGTYDEDVVFNKAVTVRGAQAGVDGAAAGRGVADGAGETTLIGRHDVSAAGAVSIDGLRFLNDATTTGGGANEGNLHFLTGGGHELRNSVFYSTVRGAANDDRAIFFNVIESGEVTIADNLITGAFASGFGQASWGRAVWFNGGGVDLALTGNTIDFARTGANLDMGGDSAATVEGNTFRTNGTAVSIGVTADSVTFADNNYQNVGGDLNLRNLTDGTVFDAEIAAATVTPSSALDYFEVLAGAGDDTILGTAGNDYLDGNNNPAQLAAADRDTLQGRGGDDLLFGRGGDDLLNGGAGNDTLNGGVGTDTAAYVDVAAITATGTGWSVTNLGEGTDVLTDIEIVDDAAAGRTLLVGNGGFATIQAAVDAAEDGDTILVAAGTYDGDVVFSKAVTVLGARAGVGGNAAGRGVVDGAGETTLIGDHDITAAGAVVIDGLRFLNDSTTTGGVDAGATLGIGKGAGHQVRNSVFYSAVNGAANGVDDRAIFVSPAASGSITLVDNYITGAFASGFGGGSWGRGLYFNGGGVDLVLTGNTIEYTRTGVNLDMNGGSAATVSGNIFQTDGTAISVAITADNITFADNGFVAVGTDFNLRALADGIVFDGELAAATVTPVAVGNLFQVWGGTGEDQLSGTAGDDELNGNQSVTPNTADADVLDGREGDDLLLGKGGDDTLIGGGGNDTAAYAGAAADYTISGQKDGNGFFTSFTGVSDDKASDGDDGADSLSGVETLRFANGETVSLVGSVQLTDADGAFVGSFATIQAAIDAASADYTITLAPGEYREKITIDVAGLTINGAGATLLGSLLQNYGIAKGGLYEYLTGPNASTPDTTGIGLTVAADGVTINGLGVTGWYDAALLADGTDGLTLSGVDFTSNLNGLRKATDADVTDLVINDGSFSDGYVGMLMFKNIGVGNAAVGNLSNVLISGTDFANLARKGIYAETLSDARITGISMTNVGQFGAAAGLDGPNGTFGAGINLNLKNGIYSDIEIDNFTMVDVGASKGGGFSHFAGAAIVITARDDGGTYGPAPATFIGAVEIHDGTISGLLATGIAVGEPGRANADPDVKVTGVTIEGEQAGAAFGTVVNNADGAMLTFNGSANDDVIFAGGDSDGPIVLNGMGGDDVLTGGRGMDTLDGGDGSDDLFGGVGADALNGGANNDLLDGGAGADAMAGGTGDDDYIVDDAGDTVTENANEGMDTVFASITHALSASVDNLTLTGTTPIDGAGNGLGNVITGNGAANMLTGNSGNDTLVGGAGADILHGGADEDTADYSGSSAAVTVDLSAGTGLGGDAEGDTLQLVENVVGSGFGDSLTGGVGVNVLAGGDGGDRYFVGSSADQVIELMDGGVDTVTATASYTLGANVENLTLNGAAAANLTGTGNMLGNGMTGDGGNNTLVGQAGDDLLDGGLGNDTLIGGTDDDTYVVAAGDTVVEQANEGTDTIRTALNGFTLQTNVENLTFTGAGTFTGTGNSVANAIIGGAGADKLDGKAGADTLVGLGGNDSYVVDNAGDVVVEAQGGGMDTVSSGVTYTLGAEVENLTLTGSSAIGGTGNALDNRITGNGAANALDGGAGNDVIDGGNGVDVMIGGTGDDTYVVGNPDDRTIEQEGEGTDLVVSNTITYTLDANVENLTLVDKKAVTGIGNELDNVITGNASANTLTGGAGDDLLDGRSGADAMRGGADDDTYVVDNSGDQTIENAEEGTDTVRTSLASLTLGANLENLAYTGSLSFTGIGNAQANDITGGAGSDTLDGKGGADMLRGLGGNDTYLIDDAGDRIVETTGTDTVITGLNTYALGDGLENLAFNGSGRFTGTGNAAANTITGSTGNDLLDGGAGIDRLVGGAGDDSYFVDSASDVVVEASGGGIDTVSTGAAAYTLGANVENLAYTGEASFAGIGNELANRIEGGAFADTLDGRVGADTLVGLDGDDIYLVDNAGDAVVETDGEGADTVRSTAAAYTLGANVENLVLLTGAASGTGNALGNSLTGNGSANRLDGGAGDDTMAGGSGSDTYLVDSVSDVVIEGSGTSNGAADLIETTVATYTLKGNVENLTFVGAGNFAGTGTSAANIITGGSGNDTIDGGDGTDRMIGLGGNDTYVVSRAEDLVVEAAGDGDDQVLSAATSYQLAANVESVRLIANARDVIGNALNNLLVGNGGANRLDGGAGADELRGGSGNDTFVFQDGEADGDVVADFTGAGAASGDSLRLVGYGTYAEGARITQVGASDFYTLVSADGSLVETIQIEGVYNFNTGAGSNDYLFSAI